MDLKIKADVTENEMLELSPEELWEKYSISEEQYHYWHKKFQEM